MPEFRQVYQVEGDEGCYEWSTVTLFKNEFGAYASNVQNGCSCNYYETPTYEELEWTYGDVYVIEKFNSAIDSAYHFSLAHRAESKMKVRQLLS